MFVLFFTLGMEIATVKLQLSMDAIFFPRSMAHFTERIQQKVEKFRDGDYLRVSPRMKMAPLQ